MPHGVDRTDPQSAAEPAPVRRAEPFHNEPHTDFSRREHRAAFQQALDEVAGQLGATFPLVIDGKATETRRKIVSLNPSHKRQTVGTVASAGPEHVEQALAAARRSADGWRDVDPSRRAEFLEVMAAEMRNRRFELAAWEVYECGKPWADADADVAEAIDFLNYYAQQMRDLAIPVQADYPGEENTHLYRPRGVCVVIAPWNFPLAILTGMTSAALVSGNTVIMKPAEQSAVVAAQLMSIARDAGLPRGVLNYLPGVGEEIGPLLVGSPEVDVIAFTGSRPVGLSINKLAADTDPRQHGVKRVIAEMGGKNAIIVDEDADLDEAVQGVVESAFGYSGQKCSACSRVIVHRACHDAFLSRLRAAAASLKVGPAEDPGTIIGPVIDADAFERIHDYIALGKAECTTVLATDVGALVEEGFYIGPHVFADVEPRSRLAQQEIFGPVLAVLPAASLDQALAIANDVDYALTGGCYSRSPRNLERVRREMQVGNLYLNRPITGALVHRHPFGGYKFSGIGTKAGGRDYLLQFLIPVTISENTLRRGFAPPPSDRE